MSRRIDIQGPEDLANATFEEVTEFCYQEGPQFFGSNSRALLAEIARRLEMPADAVSVAIVRPDKKKADTTYSVWHWGKYSSERVEKFRQIPGRTWNSITRCNKFKTSSERDPQLFDVLNELFTKTLVVGPNGHRIESGQAEAAWFDPMLYELSDAPHKVNLGEVLEAFHQLRPDDHPSHIALLGDMDGEYRTFFGKGLLAKPDILENFDLFTQHQQLLFRLSVTHGQPRYLVYSAKLGRPLEVVFGDSKDASRAIATFKETHQRLGHPVLEQDADLTTVLQSYILDPESVSSESPYPPHSFADTYYDPWAEFIRPYRTKLEFSAAKQLIHDVFDACDRPRPFVKCMRPTYPKTLLGWVSAEYETFLKRKTSDDTVIHEAAHLLAGDIYDPQQLNHGTNWLLNYLYLLPRWTHTPKEQIQKFIAAVSEKANIPLEAKLVLVKRELLSSWAQLKPSDQNYEMAVRSGCHLYYNKEPLPLRDPL